MPDPATLSQHVENSDTSSPPRQHPGSQPEELFDRALTTLAEAEEALREAARESRAVSRPHKQKLVVSIVIPVYNECATITEIVDRVRKVGLHEEIVIVDDCSTDGTRDILIELGQLPDVQVFMHGYHKGKGAALRTAMQELHGDVVIMQNADLEFDPADLEELLAPIERGEADVVFGSRFYNSSKRLMTRLSNLTTGLSLTDIEPGYKAFRRDVLREMTFRERQTGFESEFIAKIARSGSVVREVPVDCDGTDNQRSFRDSLATLQSILRYAWAD